MAKYDLIIVLGTQPDPKTWEFPRQLHACLGRAAQLFTEGGAPFIVTSGDRAIGLDYQKIVQPFRECDKMKDILISKGVPADSILVEGQSRDTISNLYYLKENILLPRKATNLLFVVASFRIARLKLLCDKVLGPDYQVGFELIKAEQGPVYNESRTRKVQSLFLEPMPAGDHHWLDGKFYGSWVYQYWRERIQNVTPSRG